jgi:hypothetical protein
MIALTDTQLRTVMRAALPLPPDKRNAYLERIAGHLGQLGCDFSRRLFRAASLARLALFQLTYIHRRATSAFASSGHACRIGLGSFVPEAEVRAHSELVPFDRDDRLLAMNGRRIRVARSVIINAGPSPRSLAPVGGLFHFLKDAVQVVSLRRLQRRKLLVRQELFLP